MRDVRSGMGAYDETRLYEELERITAEACSLAADGDTERLATLAEQRQALVELIQRSGVAVDAGAVTRILELDRELVACLTSRRANVRHELNRLAWARTSLSAYGTAPRPGAVYVQRSS